VQTNLSESIRQSNSAIEIETILRACVHCGFCNATCPTYQIRGDELDGPRGRIYQMKQYFEGAAANSDLLTHLDRCLTCRSCETTCPSGVKYSRLLEIGRHQIETDLPRPFLDRMKRKVIVGFINSGWFFDASLKLAQSIGSVLPATLGRNIPKRQVLISKHIQAKKRKVLMLKGCVQQSLTPNTNRAVANLLQGMDIEMIEMSANQCCGAAASHTSDPEKGLQQARHLIDLWWPTIESGVEAILVSATGCGVTVKDYSSLFENDPDYAEKAKKVTSLFRDVVEVVEENMDRLEFSGEAIPENRVAFHTPCSMQHGLGLNHRVEKLLSKAGFQICPVADGHLCCGSAGTYSMLQPELAVNLRSRKQKALQISQPEIIATANVGCQVHLAYDLDLPVVHWAELLYQASGR
jgi:glycolate oxidase iron-sulfur subunit